MWNISSRIWPNTVQFVCEMKILVLTCSVHLICGVHDVSARLSPCYKPAVCSYIWCHVVHPGWSISLNYKQWTKHHHIWLLEVLDVPTHPSSNTVSDSHVIYDTSSSVQTVNRRQTLSDRASPPLSVSSSVLSLLQSVDRLLVSCWNWTYYKLLCCWKTPWWSDLRPAVRYCLEKDTSTEE